MIGAERFEEAKGSFNVFHNSNPFIQGHFSTFTVSIVSPMKTITLDVNDELAERFNKMGKVKREALLKILVDRITSSTSLSDLLEFSALQAEKQGMTDEKLKELLKDE